MKKQKWLLLFLGCALTTVCIHAQDTNDKKTRENGEKRELREKHQEELKGLSPEERQAKMRELRKQDAAKRPNLKGLTLEERQAKRKEMRERLQKQLDELRQKRTEGTLTETEKKRLERMEEVARRFEQAKVRAGQSTTNQVHREERPAR